MEKTVEFNMAGGKIGVPESMINDLSDAEKKNLDELGTEVEMDANDLKMVHLGYLVMHNRLVGWAYTKPTVKLLLRKKE
jgi:hypothetical protein